MEQAKNTAHNYLVDPFSDHPWQNSDYITVKYDSNGNRKWVRRFDGSFRGHDIPKAIGPGIIRIAEAFSGMR